MSVGRQRERIAERVGKENEELTHQKISDVGVMERKGEIEAVVRNSDSENASCLHPSVHSAYMQLRDAQKSEEG